MRIVQHIDDAHVQSVAHLESLRGPGYVTYHDVDSSAGGTQVQRRARVGMAHAALPRNPLPLLLREPGIRLCLFQHCFVNERNLGICFRRLWKTDGNLIPHPLPNGRKIEVLARHRVIVDEGGSSSSGMSLVRPGTIFQDRSAEEIDLNDFAGYTIDLHPVTHTDSTLAHENEPAKKGQNKALQSNGKTGRRQPKDG